MAVTLAEASHRGTLFPRTPGWAITAMARHYSGGTGGPDLGLLVTMEDLDQVMPRALHLETKDAP